MVGAGVVGLSCAVRLLEAGHRVDVFARDLPLETTSSVAAAVWSPYSRPQEHVVRWARASYDAFATLCDDESTGVVMRTGTELFREQEEEDEGRPERGKTFHIGANERVGVCVTPHAADSVP